MTARLQPGERLVIASHNQGKVREFRELFAPFGVAVVSAGELELPEPEETGDTFAANAELKAIAAATGAGLPALSDDSGLAVDALGGEPGIHSARWAGPSKDFTVAMKKVQDRMQAAGATAPEQRRASFVCVLSFARPGTGACSFEGRIQGQLVWPPRGSRGFGYDPMFQPQGATETFGEMLPERKHAMSHRARAFAHFQAECLRP